MTHLAELRYADVYSEHAKTISQEEFVSYFNCRLDAGGTGSQFAHTESQFAHTKTACAEPGHAHVDACLRMRGGSGREGGSRSEAEEVEASNLCRRGPKLVLDLLPLRYFEVTVLKDQDEMLSLQQVCYKYLYYMYCAHRTRVEVGVFDMLRSTYRCGISG
jgi:hypothetical protein